MDKFEIEKDPLWFQHAIIYQLHVRGYFDLNGDGIGDFSGLTQKLDYLESLGITAVWLLPFFPSPLKDDGYDISDYLGINSNYGSLRDFRLFLREAHRRGIRVIIELVINHTSDQHPWFQRARRSPPGSVWRNYYVWSDTIERYQEARIIFKDFESSNWAWDPVAKAYYWHRFYSHQPDLNFDNPRVQKEIFRALEYWFEMGVDGLRLDAVPYLYEREGTNCENLPQTHEFIRKLRKHVDGNFEGRVLIAEANQWPEDAAAYFGKSDECQMAFHFPVMPRLFMAIQLEDRFPIIDILEQTPVPPVGCQWIMFLRNHDELTLEMVSDEERDYMYRSYAKDPKSRINLGIRRRLAPLLDNDRAKIELMNILLFSLPGTPVIYYGDEIGMGDNYYLGDRNGVRTPMQWSSDRNAGFSKANPQKLFLPLIIDPSYHYEVINVDNQERYFSSLLWWTRRVLLVRKNYKAFGSGVLEFVVSTNPKVIAFTRTHEQEIILVVANLSRFPQSTELDLKQYAGYAARELFHSNPFPTVTEGAYNITLSPYGYFWVALKPSVALIGLAAMQEEDIPNISVEKSWENIFKGKCRLKLEAEALPLFLRKSRWFERKASTIQSARIIANIAIGQSYLCFLEVRYHEVEDLDLYLLPLSFLQKMEEEPSINTPQEVIATLNIGDTEGVLYDSIYDEKFREALLHLIINKKRIREDSNELVAYSGGILKRKLLHDLSKPLASQVFKVDQSNSSIIYGQQFFLKLYRRLEEGIHAEIETEQFLTEKGNFIHTPLFCGAIEWHRAQGLPISIGLLQSMVKNEGTGWTFALDALTSYYERVLTLKSGEEELASRIEEKGTLEAENPSWLEELIGRRYLEAANLLGQRTGEMHLALCSRPDDLNFNPEFLTLLDQRSIYQTMRRNVRTVFQLVRKNTPRLSEHLRGYCEEALKSEQEILNIFQKTLEKKFSIIKMRIHGDYHLGQVLYTGKDFCVIDFEGEPLLPMSARRIKRSPIWDLAGMVRSFHYAAYRALIFNTAISPEVIPKLEPWGDFWYQKMSQVFLKSYQKAIQQSSVALVPANPSDFASLLQAFILEKVVYELSYEINMRPDWIVIACKGITYNLRNRIAFLE